MKLEIYLCKDGQQLEVFRNTNDLLCIKISDGSSDVMQMQLIEMCKEDAMQLAKDIVKIAKQLPDND
jgi:hypothetical protein